jgi:phage terminase large subunit
LRRWISNTSNRTNRSNPNVATRRDFINAIFENKNNNTLLIGLNCPKLMADLTYLKQDPNGNKLKEKAKDEATGVTSEKYGHTSDSMDYFITTVLKTDFERWQKQQ